ncbi:hypothetical protein AL073_00660 [Loktanella sp. 1ANDIMAR09]|nr:hypothetical protein AL073_00660 [Loktanella sp. 1ANDIMAR09]
MAEQMRIAAEDIAQAILEITGEALLKGDFDAFAAVFHVPQHMATIIGPIYMETHEDMRRAFDAMHRCFQETGVTELRREVTDARYISNTRIESTHVGETRTADGKIEGPYPVFSTIEKIDGTWKVTGGEYVMKADSMQTHALSKADTSARDTLN